MSLLIHILNIRLFAHCSQIKLQYLKRKICPIRKIKNILTAKFVRFEKLKIFEQQRFDNRICLIEKQLSKQELTDFL